MYRKFFLIPNNKLCFSGEHIVLRNRSYSPEMEIILYLEGEYDLFSKRISSIFAVLKSRW
ncbi:MAG TPA: hypothetical protein DDY68_03620 [Porphyromonadaceae bacterium]|nr:hypothetical protein [Porphyromonadaceae bacterium]